MVHRVGTAAGVERVGVGKIGLSAQGTYQVGHAGGIVGSQKCQVARLSEVHLDGDELVLEVYRLDAGGLGYGFHFLHQGKAGGGVQVSEINFCFFHNV